jgi:hypothetical protein
MAGMLYGVKQEQRSGAVQSITLVAVDLWLAVRL